jgi:Nif-specific regulatory protein
LPNDNDVELFLSDKLLNQIKKIAESNATLLILGESGVGKDVVANRVHELSHRSLREPVILNVAAIPSDLLEKELFGSIKGAFTGAEEDFIGKFRLAHNSTLILDEIGELPLNIQGKLLNAIEKGIIQPVGSNDTYNVNCRIIGISNKNLLSLVDNGLFRKDLYYRLNVVSLHIPPLRDRVSEIKKIAKSFIREFSTESIDYSISETALNDLVFHDWPGNLREMKNCLERAVTLSDKEEITSEYLLLSSDNNVNISCITLKEAINNFKRKYIMQVLESNDWNVTRSAKILDIQRTYLSRLIKELCNE